MSADTPSGPPPAPSAPALHSRRPGKLRALLPLTLAAVVLMVLAVPAALWWALRSDGGSAWLLRQVPGLQVSEARGALWGDFSARRIEWLLPGAGGKLLLDDAAWQGLQIDIGSHPGEWLAVQLRSLQARRAELVLAPRPADTPPSTAPTDLRLPLSLQVQHIQVGEFHLAALGQQPLRGLDATLHLGSGAGGQHQIELHQLQWDRLAAHGALQIGADAPLPLSVTLALRPEAGADTPAWAGDWRAEASLSGPLARPQLRASVRRTQAEGQIAPPAPSLEADAVLLPFAAWPLAQLQARTRELDLSTLVSSAPRTRLSGDATLTSNGLDQPASASIRLSNSAAGRWNDGQLPLRQLSLDLQARPGAPEVLTLKRFDADLGSSAQPAGRITGSGQLDHGRWTLDTTLERLNPAGLDARAPAMQLSGPVKLHDGKPSAALPQAARLYALLARLEGSLTGSAKSAPPVQLVLDAQLQTGPDQALKLAINQAELRAGEARAQLSGEASRPGATAPWQLQAAGRLQAFDPRAWWPGAPSSAWRRGPHRLDADLQADIRIDPGAPARTAPASDPLGSLLAALAPVRGTADLTLRPSVLAGVALEGAVQLKTRGTTSGTTSGTTTGPVVAQAVVKLTAAGNRLQADLQTASGQPDADAWKLDIDAPQLARLAPAAAALGLLPAQPQGSTTGLSGSLLAQARVNGRWPSLRSEGRLTAQALRAGPLALQRGALSWQLGTRSDAPVQLQADLAQLAYGTARADTVKLELSGTAREHRISLSADSSVLPPAWVEGLGGAVAVPTTSKPGTSPSAATLQASGQLQFARAAPGGAAAAGSPAPWSATGWRGRVETVQLRSGLSPASALGLSSRALDIEAGWGPGQASRLVVQPGRIELRAGATQAALRWNSLRWQAGSAAAAGQAAQAARMSIDAELEPIAVVPLLARLQPDFGWSGDLQVGGRIKLNSSPALTAEVVLERLRGDLSVTDESGTQALGLSDLRLALNADKGVWNFTQALAGSTLGVAAGAVVARTGSDTAWPGANTPIQGVIELQVANLGTWGNWVPAGWRLGGQLRTSASIAGRLGAPEYTGEVRGKAMSVRNFAEGVNISGGEVAITLQGDTARIDTFTAQAGQGSVKLSGDARFGSAPQARLKLVADQFQLLGRVDRRIVASGQGQLLLETGKIALDGDFRVDEGLIDFTRGDAPSLSDDVVVVRSAAPPASAASGAAAVSQAAVVRSETPAAARPTTAAQRAVALNLRVNLGEQLRLRGRGLDTGLRGELLITSPGGRLAVNGTLSTRGGTYNAYGQKLTIDRGRITFSGRVENPQLDIEATRPNVDVRVGVTVSGTAGNPRIRLFSEPELPEVDKLSWLVLGRATDGLGRTDTALLQRAAVALLAGEGGGLTDRLTGAIGLDELSLRQTTDGEVRETVVSLGKQLSRRWYVGYERGLNATAGTWQLIYRIAQRFTLRAQGGFENSLDLIWTWRWQ